MSNQRDTHQNPAGGALPADQPTRAAPAPADGAEPRTQIGGVRPGSLAPGQDAMADPVVGWLVVAEGPGKGSFVKLGSGQNSIGRSSGQRVALDFGDSEISRENHATLTYDPRGKSFYIQQGSGKNLAYLDGAPVLSPTPLPAMSRVALGRTTLLFVPLCGDAFSWD